jgi:hypothetical protein
MMHDGSGPRPLRLGSALTTAHALAIRDPEITSPFSFSKSVCQFFISPWNCAHEFERPPAHVQIDAPVITHALIPFCPIMPRRHPRTLWLLYAPFH